MNRFLKWVEHNRNYHAASEEGFFAKFRSLFLTKEASDSLVYEQPSRGPVDEGLGGNLLTVKGGRPGLVKVKRLGMSRAPLFLMRVTALTNTYRAKCGARGSGIRAHCPPEHLMARTKFHGSRRVSTAN